MLIVASWMSISILATADAEKEKDTIIYAKFVARIDDK
jgi:hypothetical protein